MPSVVGACGLGVSAMCFGGIASVMAKWDRRLTRVDNITVMVAGKLLFGKRGELVTRCRTAEEVRGLTIVKKIAESAETFRQQSSDIGFSLETVRVPVEGGEIDVHIFRPKAAAGDGLPMIVWYHGGGMCIGNAMDSILGKPGFGILQHFQGKAVIASVDYRLAPEHRFPTGADDAVAAAVWLQANAGRFGCDPAKMCAAGNSAGGNLAAVVHQAASKWATPLSGAVIITPMMRYGATTQSYIDYGQGFGMTYELLIWFWNTYCPDSACSSDPRCEPIRGLPDIPAESLASCLVATSQFDQLHDEGVEYFQAMKTKGVRADHLEIHATHLVPFADKKATPELLQWLSSALSVPVVAKV